MATKSTKSKTGKNTAKKTETTTATSTATATADSCCAVEDECCDGETAFHPVHGTVCHVEFTVPDLTKASKFYGNLFGWEFFAFGENEMYFQATNAGPCGCIAEGKADTDGKTTIYVNVDDIGTTLTKAKKLGATVTLPKTEIAGGHGFTARIRAPEGNVFGIYNRS